MYIVSDDKISKTKCDNDCYDCEFRNEFASCHTNLSDACIAWAKETSRLIGGKAQINALVDKAADAIEAAGIFSSTPQYPKQSYLSQLAN